MSHPRAAPFKYVIAREKGLLSWAEAKHYSEDGFANTTRASYVAVDTFDDPTPETPKKTAPYILPLDGLSILKEVIRDINQNEKQLKGTGYKYCLSSSVVYNCGIGWSFSLRLGRLQALRTDGPTTPSGGRSVMSSGMHTPASTVV
ncbi:hypothetical protein TWF718_002475 [Orbilia javanica]|uniref:Uncharacterized protein n=1 Tax=Orbilia javanica TaxID=47235 RepID=A0AAN8RJS5_9PEZI